MNQEILERLIIDRFSGELTADAAALLEDWLTREPAARADAARLEQTLRLAQRALREDRRSATLRPRFSPPTWMPRLAAMAACFVAGIGLGWLALSRPAASPPILTELRATSADSSFWSQHHLQSVAQTKAISQPFLRWTSPVREPQFIKHP